MLRLVIGDILQPTHLLFVLVIALLVLGPKRLPEVGRSLGRGLRDFRNALSGDEKEDGILSHLTGDSEPAPPMQTHGQPASPFEAPAPQATAGEPLRRSDSAGAEPTQVGEPARHVS